MTKILEALLQLDPTNNDQWTSDGLPRVEVVSELSGLTVTRKDVTDAKPGFSRAVAGKATTGASTPVKTENDNTGANNPEKPIDSGSQIETEQLNLGSTQQPEQEVDEALQEYEAKKAELEEQRAKQEEINSKVAKLQKEFDLLKIEKEESEKTTNPQAIQSYLESQKAELIRKSNLASELKQSGITVASITKALELSPLDESLKGKR